MNENRARIYIYKERTIGGDDVKEARGARRWSSMCFDPEGSTTRLRSPHCLLFALNIHARVGSTAYNYKAILWKKSAQLASFSTPRRDVFISKSRYFFFPWVYVCVCVLRAFACDWCDERWWCRYVRNSMASHRSLQTIPHMWERPRVDVCVCELLLLLAVNTTRCSKQYIYDAYIVNIIIVDDEYFQIIKKIIALIFFLSKLYTF